METDLPIYQWRCAGCGAFVDGTEEDFPNESHPRYDGGSFAQCGPLHRLDLAELSAALANETQPLELSPAKCPRCGGEAYFRYVSPEDAREARPICWGQTEKDCPGWVEGGERNDASRRMGN